MLAGLIYLAVVVETLSVAESKFETLVLGGLIQLYAAVLYNFSVLGVSADINNHAAFVRFRILAAAQGITENEDGAFVDQEKALADAVKDYGPIILIRRISNWVVSLYALLQIIRAIL